MAKGIVVTKMSGEREPYNEEKLARSLRRAGATPDVIQQVLAKSRTILYDGIPTKELFAFAFKELRKHAPVLSLRYKLKQAILDLGQPGYVFEKFIAKLLEKQGYRAVLNTMVRGKLVSHEIDVSAARGKERLMVECKHHSKPWLGCHIDTALMVYARFLDVSSTFTKPLLVTNTKFTTTLITYANGVGLGLMGWKYPPQASLEQAIEQQKLYPITILHVPKSIVGACTRNNIITVEDLCGRSGDAVAKLLRISRESAEKLLAQCRALHHPDSRVPRGKI